MRIVILSLIFSPDNVSTAQIWAGIAENLKKRGNDLRVITTTPHFHRDASMEAKQPRRKVFGRWIQKSEYAGIPVYHILMPDKSIWPPLRILSWINFHIVSTLIGWFMRFKPDVLIAPSPPLTIGINAWAIAAVRRAKYIYNVQEIYPDIAVNLGILKNRFLIGFFRWIELLIYRKASCITSITKSMCEKISTRTEHGKVRLVPNFVDLSEVLEAPRINTFSKEYGLVGKFVLTYAGNMGVPQRLGVLIELARRIPTLTVLMVGGGGDAEHLKKEADGLSNVIFVEYQPISRMPEIYAASDMFYVGQEPHACADGIPSKIYRILGYGKPLLVMTSQDSDLAEFVRDSQSGVLLDEDMEKSSDLMLRLMGESERLRIYGENGCRYVKEFYDRVVVSQKYAEICNEICPETDKEGR